MVFTTISYINQVGIYSPLNYSIEKQESGASYFFHRLGAPQELFEAVPWCDTVQDILNKAFLIRKNATTRHDGQGQFYLFQFGGTGVLNSCSFADPTIERAIEYNKTSDNSYNLEIHSGYDAPEVDFLVLTSLALTPE